jgi:hypothetical protein
MKFGLAELHVFVAACHVMFFGAPEGEDFNRELRRFINRCWKRGMPAA